MFIFRGSRRNSIKWVSYNFNYLRKKMLGKIYLCWAKYLFKAKNRKTEKEGQARKKSIEIAAEME